MRRYIFILCLFLIPVSGFAAVSQATFLFLTVPPSPLANGMAGVYTRAGNEDPYAVWTQPGVLGIQSEQIRVQAGFYTHRTNWLPHYYLDNIDYGARSLFVGFNREWMRRHFHSAGHISSGISYSEVDLDLGTSTITDNSGNPLGTFDSRENAKMLSLGLGYHLRSWQAGFSFGLKHSNSELADYGAGNAIGETEASATSLDLGVLLRTQTATWFLPEDYTVAPFVTPEIGYSMLNYGGEVAYIDRAQADPLPRIARLHFGIDSGLETALPENLGRLRLFSLGWGRDSESSLVKRDPFGRVEYRNPFGALNPVSDIIGGRAGEDVILYTGWEFGLLETYALRGGRTADAGAPAFYDYEGYSLKSAGAFKLLSCIRSLRQNSVAGFLLRHIDVEYSHSERTEDNSTGYPLLYGIANDQLTLRLHY